VLARHEVRPGADFAACASTWSTGRDGVPASGTKYIVEAQLVLFATDAPAPGAPAAEWNPHARNFEALWSRTLRQAEE
jgi:hypothetical protein